MSRSYAFGVGKLVVSGLALTIVSVLEVPKWMERQDGFGPMEE